MESSSRSRRGPVLFIVSAVLAFMAISTAVHSISKNSEPPITSVSHELSTNASNALQRAGFTITADLLRHSLQFYLPQENFTIFAIEDYAFENITLPPPILKNLLLYHTSTSKLSMADLLKKPSGSCIQTLFRRKNIAITKIDSQERSVEINHVMISMPDLFLDEKITIHGVLAPFSFLNSRETRVKEDMDFDSIVDGIQWDFVGFDSVTIFAPPDFELVGSSSISLDRGMGLHIIQRTHFYASENFAQNVGA